MPNTIFAIASSIGTPVYLEATINKSMLEHSFCCYTRILVDVDLSGELRDQILVESKGFDFLLALTMQRYSNSKV
jgi:hypothetical protein